MVDKEVGYASTMKVGLSIIIYEVKEMATVSSSVWSIIIFID